MFRGIYIGQSSKGKKSKLKCWFCGKYGHLKKDCWKQQQASKEYPPKETKEENATETGSTTSSGMVDEVLKIGIVSRYDQQWLLDFGASNHMCLHRHWFITYHTIDHGIVYMGNDISCKVCSTTQVFQQRTNAFSNHSHNQIKDQHTDVFTW
jgi:hypothetical protein